MEKGYESINDSNVEINDSGSDAVTDFGGDLASDDGVDLNSGIDDVKDYALTSPNLEKTGIGGRFGAAAQIPLGIFSGSTAYAPNEHVQEIMNEPVAGYHQVYERPEDPYSGAIKDGAGPAPVYYVEHYPEPEYADNPPDPPKDDDVGINLNEG
jgi:hypothetical protein